jgi:hypothetical protein
MAKDPVRVAAGKKAWETRRANEEFDRRSEAAKKGWDTRRAREAQGDITFELEDIDDEIDEIEEDIEEAAEKALEVIVQMAVEIARSHAPVKTGELSNSIHGYIQGDAGVITADAPHAAIQEYGGDPKEPFTGYSASGFMAFEPGTSDPPHGAKLVHSHPGNPAVGFMRAAEDFAAEKGAEIVVELLG